MYAMTIVGLRDDTTTLDGQTHVDQPAVLTGPVSLSSKLISKFIITSDSVQRDDHRSCASIRGGFDIPCCDERMTAHADGAAAMRRRVVSEY